MLRLIFFIHDRLFIVNCKNESKNQKKLNKALGTKTLNIDRVAKNQLDV